LRPNFKSVVERVLNVIPTLTLKSILHVRHVHPSDLVKLVRFL
jgi:hypothetical protein